MFYANLWVNTSPGWERIRNDPLNPFAGWELYNHILLISFLGLLLSASVTRRVTMITITYIDNRGTWANVAVAITVLVLMVALLIFWLPMTRSVVIAVQGWYQYGIYERLGLGKGPGFIINLQDEIKLQFDAAFRATSPSGFFRERFTPDSNTLVNLPMYTKVEMRGLSNTVIFYFGTQLSVYVVNGFRLIIAIAFAALMLSRPLFGRPMSLVWLRVIQSDKPLFTLMLGGVSGAVTLAAQIVKHVLV
jgi:hypothetical protein